MHILIACEFSGIVRDSFITQGHTAISCDLLPTEREGPHIQGDVRNIDLYGYDLMIAHPPCTYLASSGARWFRERLDKQKEALEFVRWLMNVPVPKVAIENPVGVIGTKIKKPTQTIQPWQFGDLDYKKTCLWLKNLPPLKPTKIMPFVYREFNIHRASENPERWRERSRFFPGIAKAMAEQWTL